jgi:hypothetical protein
VALGVSFGVKGRDHRLDWCGAADGGRVRERGRALASARPAVPDGAPGLLAARSGLPGGILEQWFVVRGAVVHVVTLYRSPAWPQDSPYLRSAFTKHAPHLAVDDWQWMSCA